jgi:hypothetical protein
MDEHAEKIVEEIGGAEIQEFRDGVTLVSAMYQGSKCWFAVGEKISMPLTGMDLILVRYDDGTFRVRAEAK